MKYVFVKGLTKDQLEKVVEKLWSGVTDGHFKVYTTDDPLCWAICVETSKLQKYLNIFDAIARIDAFADANVYAWIDNQGIIKGVSPKQELMIVKCNTGLEGYNFVLVTRNEKCYTLQIKKGKPTACPYSGNAIPYLNQATHKHRVVESLATLRLRNPHRTVFFHSMPKIYTVVTLAIFVVCIFAFPFLMDYMDMFHRRTLLSSHPGLIGNSVAMLMACLVPWAIVVFCSRKYNEDSSDENQRKICRIRMVTWCALFCAFCFILFNLFFIINAKFSDKGYHEAKVVVERVIHHEDRYSPYIYDELEIHLDNSDSYFYWRIGDEWYPGQTSGCTVRYSYGLFGIDVVKSVEKE